MRYVLEFSSIILPHPTKFCQCFILLIENFNLYSDEDGVKHIRIKARPNKWHENDCPFCHKSCEFYKQLTPEQLSSIKVVTGDGAKWITECVNEYTPDCARCVDSFHVVEWAMTVLDEVRKDIWHDAYSEYKQVKKDNPCGKGRPKKDDPELAIVKAAKAKADEIKGSAYMIKVLCFLFDTKYHMHYIISF